MNLQVGTADSNTQDHFCYACVRCPLLRVGPDQLPRLQGIHANLVDRLTEAKEQGWLGEVAAIETTMAAAAQKLKAMHAAAMRRGSIHLGVPDIRASTGRSTESCAPQSLPPG